jgi:hypothetical protein
MIGVLALSLPVAAEDVSVDSTPWMVPRAAATDPAHPSHWSARKTEQRIQQLKRITSAQRGADELIRILVAVMHQPDPALRSRLFNQLRPFIRPYNPNPPDKEDSENGDMVAE